METCLRVLSPRSARYQWHTSALWHITKGRFSRAACLSEHFVKSGGSTRKETSREFLEDVVFRTFHSQEIPVRCTGSCYRGLTQSSQCREKGLSVLQRFKQLPEKLLDNNKLNSHAYLQRRHNLPLCHSKEMTCVRTHAHPFQNPVTQFCILHYVVFLAIGGDLNTVRKSWGCLVKPQLSDCKVQSRFMFMNQPTGLIK